MADRGVNYLHGAQIKIVDTQSITSYAGDLQSCEYSEERNRWNPVTECDNAGFTATGFNECCCGQCSSDDRVLNEGNNCGTTINEATGI